MKILFASLFLLSIAKYCKAPFQVAAIVLLQYLRLLLKF